MFFETKIKPVKDCRLLQLLEQFTWFAHRNHIKSTLIPPPFSLCKTGSLLLVSIWSVTWACLSLAPICVAFPRILDLLSCANHRTMPFLKIQQPKSSSWDRRAVFYLRSFPTLVCSIRICRSAFAFHKPEMIGYNWRPILPQWRKSIPWLESQSPSVSSIWVKKWLHLIVIWMRKPIPNFIELGVLFFWRRKWKTGNSFEQGPPGLVGSDGFIFLMFSYQLTHDAPHRPHFDCGVIFVLHQNQLRGSVPPTDHMACQKLALLHMQVGSSIGHQVGTRLLFIDLFCFFFGLGSFLVCLAFLAQISETLLLHSRPGEPKVTNFDVEIFIT